MSGDLEMIEKSLALIFQIPETLPTSLRQNSEIRKFLESINYSLLGGGKRFRPNLVLAVADSYKQEKSQFLPFALAVEMIHTYSLIHDDLPSMDNDKERRGKPTNHIVYGESSALLAGDALLTEAFSFLGRSYFERPSLGLDLVTLLSEAAGVRGMIGGQVLDMMTVNFSTSDEIIKMHELKTGALIRVSIEGAARIALALRSGTNQQSSSVQIEEQKLWKEFGHWIGLSFQLSDDILDFNQQERDHKNFASATSVEKTKEMLVQVSKQAEQALQQLLSKHSVNTENLNKLIAFNLNRKV